MGIFDFFKKNKVVKDFDKFSKSIDTSSFSDNQKKATQNFMSDISKGLKKAPDSGACSGAGACPSLPFPLIYKETHRG